MKLALATLAVVATASLASAAAPVGVDGALGAEWTGILPKPVAAAPYGQPGVGVEYDVYAREDAQYFYTLVKANPAGEGQDNWTSTIAAQLGNVVNLGLDLDPPPVNSNGSDMVLETENNRYATFDNVGNVIYSPYSATNGIVQASTAVRGYSDADPGFAVEFAIPWSFFETDPDGTGRIPLLTPTNPSLILRYSQSFDGTFDLHGPEYGPTRFGQFVDPNFAAAPEPATLTVLGAASALGLRRRRRA